MKREPIAGTMFRRKCKMRWLKYTSQTPRVKRSGSIPKYIVKELGKELCECSHEFFKHKTTDGRRTEIIKCALARIGDERDYKVYANKLSKCPRPSDGGEWKSREWLYDLHWYTEVDEIKVKDLRKFIDMLRRPDDSDKLSPYLWNERLNAKQRKTLEHYQSSGSSATNARKVVDQLIKDIIKGQSIYKPTRFNGKSLKGISPEASTLFNNWKKKLKKRLKRKSRAVSPEKLLKRHNRLLLQDIYPKKVLSRDHEYLPTRLPLVAEIEWRPKRDEDSIVPYSGYKFDFQKLLVANADLRLMIFSLRKKDNIEDLGNYFYKAIKSYRNLAKKSKFLFIAFDKRIEGFYYIKKP
jgi:hypothetical protein